MRRNPDALQRSVFAVHKRPSRKLTGLVSGVGWQEVIIEPFRFQQFIHALVKRMRRPVRQLMVADPQALLPLSPPSCPHPHVFFSRMHSHSTIPDLHHRLLEIRAP